MILDKFSLAGKVALVTGANRGLGQGLALGLAEAGADIALVGRSEPTASVTRVEALGREAFTVPVDLASADPAALEGVVSEVIAHFGRLDILVNNAGIIRRQTAAEHSAENWADVLKVNLDASFFLAQAAGRAMLAQGSGKIIFIASMLSYQGGILVPGYTASKHAVAGLVKALANEWAAAGVNVNGIAPGYMATDNTAALRADPDRAESIGTRIPAARWGLPEDLQGAVVFLASAASDYVHGAIIPIDGGWLVR
ncbi:MAG: 2-dehydro-3-deoxy-D-gluconate 5-dehydrogenase KduD [Propionibacteriaceae bacterium]|jgi:2-deoxy-D-gluconate 3-dehydrogenase|nr:2-dehydro-3-deoxy-D-gluconate 5-dehydrogenase KduD [Propionibacteriaceae bacterium]